MLPAGQKFFKITQNRVKKAGGRKKLAAAKFYG